MRSKVAAVALVGALAVAAGACNSGKGSSSNPTTASATSTTMASPSTSSGASSTTAHATTVPTVRLCATSQLSGTLGSPNGAAGTIYYQLALTNKSSSTCFVQGYPGVSFVAGSNGHQVGAPAARAPGATPSVTVAPAKTAYALLGIAEAGNFSNCQPTAVLGLRVYPPNNTAALFVPHNDTGCANTSVVTLTIHPLAATPTS